MKPIQLLHNLVIVDAVTFKGLDGRDYCIDGHVDLYAPVNALHKAYAQDSYLDDVYIADSVTGDYKRFTDLDAFITEFPDIYADLVNQMNAAVIAEADEYLTGANILSGDL